MTRIPKLLAIMILGTTFTGCSLFSNKGSVSTNTPTTPTIDAPEISQNGSINQNTATETPLNTVQSEVLDKLNGDWVIVGVNGKTVNVDDDQPYLIFEEGKNAFYASNGCNILNGNFALTSTGDIEFSNVISSMRACPQQWFHNAITKVLCDGVTVKVKWYNQGNESYAELLSHGGAKLMTLRRHNMEVLNGQWYIKEIGDKDIDNPDINLFLDIPELKIHGNTGCNYFNGEILIEPSVASSISFSQMVTTLALCPDSDIEMAMLVALEETHTYKISHNNLHFLNTSGKTVMKLSRNE